jgi:hypothetical protein
MNNVCINPIVNQMEAMNMEMKKLKKKKVIKFWMQIQIINSKKEMYQISLGQRVTRPT